MKTRTAWLVCAAGAVSVAGAPGCGLQKNKPATVLKSADFVVDPTTTPTGRPAEVADGGAAGADVVPVVESPAVSVGGAVEPAPVVGALGASDGAFDVSARAGGPELSSTVPEPVGRPVLVEAKVGEINGRPVRVQELLDDVGPRLEATARRRTLTPDDYAYFNFRAPSEEKAIDRATWLAFAQSAIASRLNGVLQDELLQAEARASLKPEQQQGLRYLVQEFAEQQRRESGGSQAELTRRLSEGAAPQTVEQLKREREILLLIQFQLDEKIRKRVRVSWKDVRLYYERNFELFNPPAKATFRMIQVKAEDAEAAARVEAALKEGKPFAEVAASADNAFEPGQGGLWGSQTFAGEYAQATLFGDPLNALAQGLTPGGWGGPVDFNGSQTWLYLDSLEQVSRPLSDRDVQLSIANGLNTMAFDAERRRYIDRLKERASFSDVDEMAGLLTEIAARRYWPE